ncbi:MAG: fluoride efflux transporter CrcB [Alphaproteobacteria bacterium]|nr:fluoride efflux transporter CrcB [Alphaproteobacteria bacterium]
MNWQILFLVMAGGGLGAGARYLCSGLIAEIAGPSFPWGTLVVNVVGSFLIGFINALSGPDGRLFISSEARQFIMLGILGGYTTFSSFSLQTLNLMRDGEWLPAGANIGLSFALCIIAVWLGHLAATSFNQLRG